MTFRGFEVQGQGGESANVIFEDRSGFIWLGKKQGLFKYDGYTLTHYQHAADDSSSLSNSHITAINEDREGFLWVGTRDGLNKFNPATGRCQRFQHDPNEQTSLSHNHITAIYFDRYGAMWVGTSSGGLNVAETGANANSLRFRHFRHDPDNPNSLSDDEVFCLTEDARSHGEIIWIGTVRGLNAWHRQTQEFTRYRHDPNDARSLNDDRVWSLCQDHAGNLWVGTGGGGVSKLNRRGDSEVWFAPLAENKPWQVATMAVDRADNLWIGTYDSCLFRLNTETLELLHFNPDPEALNGLRNPIIFAIIFDNAGTLWISSQSGISIYDPQREKLRQYALGSSMPYTPGYRNLSAICEDHTGNLWLGAWGEGLAKLDLSTERFKIYAPSAQKPNSLHSPWITALCADRGGLLWIGTIDGLDCFDPDANTFRHYGHNSANPNDPAKLSSDNLSTLYEDADGALWIGTALGVDRLDLDTGIITHYLTDARNPLRAIGYYLSAICEDDAGNILIGGKGLFRLDPSTGELRKYVQSVGDSTVWIDDLIDCVHRDASGALWIATEGNGLFRMRKDLPLLHLTEADGLPSNFVWGVLADAQGRLWISTFRGLVSLDPATNTLQRHLVADDWRSNEFRAALFHKGTSGQLYFGNLRGFVRLLPELMQPNPYVPPVRITSFKIFNKPVTFDRPFTRLDQIRLSHRQNMFSFDFVALNYTHSEKNQYAYRLEGLHDDWIPCESERTAMFMNLDPGEYVFRVKAANNDGVWNEAGASIKVSIAAPWWKTWWAYLFYAIIVTVILYALRRYDLHRQRLQHQLQLEHVHAEKLEALDRVKSHFFANISHEFRTPLTLILGPLEKLIAEAREGDLQQQFQIMLRSGKNLLDLINQLLDISKLESGSMMLRARCHNVVGLLKRMTETFISAAERKQIILTFQATQTTIMAYVDQDKLEKIVNNLLANALKFTPEGGAIEVVVNVPESDGEKGREGERESGRVDSSAPSHPVAISSSQKGRFVQITIKDTGIGIPADKIDQIFDRFYQVDSSQTRSYGGTGIGLALAKELVELHHGKISVESTRGVGTTFSVRLPLGKAHLAPEEIVEDPVPEEAIKAPLVQPAIPEADAETGTVEPSRQTLSRGKAPIVLIVEDHADLRAYMSSFLVASYRIIEAENGEDGLVRAVENIPDLIISDVMMPGMDGFTLCARLKTDERTSHIPVILLTARASTESKIAGLETGADDYVTKPFDARELQVRVKNLIEQRRRLRERLRRELSVQPGEVQVVSTEEKFLRRAIALVERHLSQENFSVVQFSRAIGMSRVQLHRKLRALTDHSASEFIRTLRLNRAAQLLAQHSGNVTEVAYEVGFNNLSYFAKCFQKQFGVSPSAYAAHTSKAEPQD